MVPAQQPLKSSDLIVSDVDDRLIEQLEFAVEDRVSKIHLHFTALLHAHIHFGLEKPIGTATFKFGFVQSKISALDKFS